jgi:hypothetical protein
MCQSEIHVENAVGKGGLPPPRIAFHLHEMIELGFLFVLVNLELLEQAGVTLPDCKFPTEL